MSTETAKLNGAEHKILLNARKTLEINGVTEVVSFDEQTVILNTVCGGLAVDGMSLHIRVLNLEQGIVTVDGRIDNLGYYETERDEKSSKGGFFGKLFR